MAEWNFVRDLDTSDVDDVTLQADSDCMISYL